MKIYSLEVRNDVASIVEKDCEGINDIRYDSKYIGSKKDIITEVIEIEYEDIDGNIIEEETPTEKFTNMHSGYGGWYLDNLAYEALKDLFDESVELYPAKSHIKEFKLLYIKDVIENSVDYDKSQIVWLSEEEKRAMMFEKYKFNEDVIKDKHIFRIKELSIPLYVSEEFRQRYIEHNLTGLNFRLVYDSEDDSMEFPFEIV